MGDSMDALRQRYEAPQAPTRTAAPKPAASPVYLELNEREKAKIARNRALVHQHIPEMLPLMKHMVELGLIEGWRNVVKVEVK
ncbi:MAG: hypothetical protein ACOY5C_02715 [Pseudomonadota bacterium]